MTEDIIAPPLSEPVITPDVQAEANKVINEVITDFKNCLNDYKSLTDTRFIGRFFDMDQQIKVGDMEIVQNVQSRARMDGVTTCPLSGELVIIHTFQTAGKTIPIPKTKYQVYEVESGYIWDSDNYVSEGKLDDNGKAVLKLKPNQKYKIMFYPNLTKKDLDKLYASYDGLISQCADWLEKNWNNRQKQEWEAYIANGASIDWVEACKEFADGIWTTLKDIWNLVCKLFDIFCHPLENAKKLKQLIGDGAEKLIQMYDEHKDEIGDMLMMLKDEAMLFIFFNATWCLFKLLTPEQLVNFSAKIVGQVLTEVIIAIILPGAVLKKGFDIAMNFA
jgi:hypothetical protein